MELFLYNNIYDYTAEYFNSQLSGHEKDDITTRINSNGGSTSAGFAMAMKLREVTGIKKAIVDGDAMSMAAFILMFFDDISVAGTSQLMLHKAAYPTWHEPSAQEQASLKTENARFKKMLEARLNEKGADIIAKIFEADVRNDVFITPQEAVEIGLANRVIDITPAQLAASSQKSALKFAEYKNKKESKNNINNIKKIMTVEEIKAANPAEYQQIVALGVKAERDRVGAFAGFLTVTDKSANERVKQALLNGEEYNMTAMADINRLTLSEMALKGAENDNPPDVNTTSSNPEDDSAQTQGATTETSEAKALRIAKMI